MYKAQYKKNSPFNAWLNIGTYGNEATAINAALQKKKSGALLVRVVDKSGQVVYSS
jgi:hypothetical protein